MTRRARLARGARGGARRGRVLRARGRGRARLRRLSRAPMRCAGPARRRRRSRVRCPRSRTRSTPPPRARPARYHDRRLARELERERVRRRGRRRARRDRRGRRLPGEPRAAPRAPTSTATRCARAPRSRRCARSSRAPLAGDGWAIVSASPELLLSRRGSRVRTSPIKGTRPAGMPIDSAKDAAEHVMIVDLERNDLSRVAVRAACAGPSCSPSGSSPA